MSNKEVIQTYIREHRLLQKTLDTWDAEPDSPRKDAAVSELNSLIQNNIGNLRNSFIEECENYSSFDKNSFWDWCKVQMDNCPED